ncbi:MAG TPA: RtcB family protein [Candidatus Nanoarchaeia archaeon]|nr:RtcB family protein [Candidatus Nanoarchaeia archaeon]
MEINKISENIYEIPKEGKMNVPARIFASEKLLSKIKEDKTLEQVRNMAMLPKVERYSIALADAHQGYGSCIGGVLASDAKQGIVSPGLIGFDINCSVRLLRTNLERKDVEKKKKEVVESLYRKIPSGVGRGSKFNMTKDELKRVMVGGAKYLVEKGYGEKNDYLYTEEEGCLEGADTEKVSSRAMQRGIGQLGTLGAGNHFVEVQYVDEIFDKNIAKVFGLEKNQVVIMVHCGSRGLGHQVASDYMKAMEDEYGIEDLPDRELINAPIKSKLGQDYLKAMACAANFAFANKQLITHWIREELKYLFPKSKVEVVYDICHNIAKFEKHKTDEKEREFLVMRKGATRSFGKGRKEIPSSYRKIGQPIIIPGSMGTSSYVLVGTEKAEELTFASTAHGAGRIMSRHAAIRIKSGEQVKQDLAKKGIEVRAGSMTGLAEEMPEAYKDIEEVVRVSDELGIGKIVARLKPMGVVKG